MPTRVSVSPATSRPIETLRLTPAPLNIDAYQGDDFYADFQLVRTLDLVYDLGAAKPLMSIRRSSDSSLVLSPVCTVTDAAAGRFEFFAPHSETRDIVGSHMYDIEAPIDGIWRTVVRGGVFFQSEFNKYKKGP